MIDKNYLEHDFSFHRKFVHWADIYICLKCNMEIWHSFSDNSCLSKVIINSDIEFIELNLTCIEQQIKNLLE